MKGLNQVNLIGRIAVEPKSGETIDGIPYTLITVECTYDDSGQDSASDCVSVQLLGELSEEARDSYKGQKIYVSGRLKTNRYKGRAKFYTFLLAEKIIFLSGNDRNEALYEGAEGI